MMKLCNLVRGGGRGSLPQQYLACSCTHPEARFNVQLTKYSVVVLCLCFVCWWAAQHCTPLCWPASKQQQQTRLCSFIGPTAMPCWWALIRVKQLSMAPTARVIWLYACVRYWPGQGLVYLRHLLFSLSHNTSATPKNNIHILRCHTTWISSNLLNFSFRLWIKQRLWLRRIATGLLSLTFLTLDPIRR